MKKPRIIESTEVKFATAKQLRKLSEKQVSLQVNKFISKMQNKGVYISDVKIERKVLLNPSFMVKSRIDSKIEIWIDEEAKAKKLESLESA